VAKSAGLSILFVGIAILAGRWIIPWLLGRVGGTRARELFLLTILAICLAAAIGTETAGLSVVFGAFLIGVVLRETIFVRQILAEVIPFRDIFSALFFISLGMLFDPVFLVSQWSLVLEAVVAIVIIKVVIVYSVVRAFGFSNRIAVLTGAGLFQIGELGFILAQGGADRGFVTAQFSALITSSAIITMLLTPVSIGIVSWLYPKLAARLPMLERVNGAIDARRIPSTVKLPEANDAGTRPVVIAGYGRVGEAIAQGLEEADIPFKVVELDPQRIGEARTMDYP
jgi:CPA2 family monovalent cation:H+ antiporter-2